MLIICNLFLHYGREWLPLVPNALGEGPIAPGEASPSATLGEEYPGYLFTGKTSSSRVENRALRKGFFESRFNTRGRIDAVGCRPAPFPSYFFKNFLPRVQHSGKKPSSPSAAAQALGEETLFPECHRPDTWGRSPLPRAPQSRHSGKKPSSPSVAAHALGEETLA